MPLVNAAAVGDNSRIGELTSLEKRLAGRVSEGRERNIALSQLLNRLIALADRVGLSHLPAEPEGAPSAPSQPSIRPEPASGTLDAIRSGAETIFEIEHETIDLVDKIRAAIARLEQL